LLNFKIVLTESSGCESKMAIRLSINKVYSFPINPIQKYNKPIRKKRKK